MNSSVLYEASLEYNGTNKIFLGVAKPRATPRYKAVAESALAGAAFLGQGSDLVTGDGVTGAVLAGWSRGPTLSPRPPTGFPATRPDRA
jgi:hypothetical protein